MKKALPLFLVLLMVLSLVACGGDTTPDDGESVDASVETNVDKDMSGADEGSVNIVEDDETRLDQEPVSVEGLTDIVDFVVADTDMYKITIADVEYDEDWEEYTVKLQFENKTENTPLTFYLLESSINGVYAHLFCWEDVEAGRRGSEELVLYLEDSYNGILEDIGEWTDIELTYLVRNADEYENVASETVNIYPLGAANATGFERETQPSDEVIVDNEYLTISVIGYEEEENGEFSVQLFLTNKTEKTYTVVTKDVYVNDFDYGSHSRLCKTLPAGKVAYSGLNWISFELEQNNINKVDKIDFVVYGEDEFGDWEDLFETETITLKP